MLTLAPGAVYPRAKEFVPAAMLILGHLSLLCLLDKRRNYSDGTCVNMLVGSCRKKSLRPSNRGQTFRSQGFHVATAGTFVVDVQFFFSNSNWLYCITSCILTSVDAWRRP